MAVRLRPQSSAWMAPHALAAQLNAQTGQIAASGPQSLLAGIAQGVGAFTQGRDKRRAEAKDDARYQDSLGFRKEEMALRKQAADREDAEGRYAILSQAAKGAEMKATLWQLSNPGQPLPPEMTMEKDQLNSSLKAIMSQFTKGVPSPQQRAGGGATGPGGWPVGQSPTEKAARGEPTGDPDVYWNEKDYAESDAAQKATESPAAPAATESASVDVPSSGDPTIDAFSERIRAMGGKAAELQAELDTFENLGPEGKRSPRASAIRTAIGKLNNDILIAQGRMQVYSKIREQKAVGDRQAAERDTEAKEQNAALRSAVNPETGRPYLSMAEPDLPAAAAALLYKQAEARAVEEGKFPTRKRMQDDRQEAGAVENEKKRTFTLDRMRQANEYSEGRIKLAAEQRRAAADEAREAGVPADQVNAIYKEIQAGHSEQRVLAARAQDLMNAGRVEEASALFDAAKMMDGDLNDLMAQMRDARMKIGQKPEGGGITSEPPETRKAKVLEAFSSLPADQQTDEEMMKMLKAAGLAR